MKESLKKIYQDVSDGKLTQSEALEKIKVLKLKNEKKTGILLSTPVWETGKISNTNEALFEQHYVILTELPNVDTQSINKAISNSYCIKLQLEAQKNIAEIYNEVAQRCFESLKNIITQKPLGKILFQVVIPVQQKEMLFVGLSGLLKSVNAENPNIKGQIVLVSSDTSTEDLVEIIEANKNSHKDEVIKYDNGIRKVLRLKEIQSLSKTPRIVFKEKGTYLITGGLGRIGLLIANEIANQTKNATLVIAEHSKLTADKKVIVDSLLTRGLNVDYQKVDVGDFEQVRKLIKGIESKHKLLNGIVHCAGINKDNFVLKKQTEEFQSVLLPKVDGTYNLDAASKEMDLDFMVLFSSVASWLGNLGQTDYAAGNGFMDQFALYRNQLVDAGERKGKTITINWPLWKEGGMKIDETTSEIISKNTGLQALETAKGLSCFYHSFELPNEQIIVTNGDIETIREQILGKEPIAKNKITKIQTYNKEIDSESLFVKTEGFVINELAEQLKIAPNQLDAQAPLEKYGIDSVLSMSLTNQLEKTFGSLPKTLFFEYLTAHDLAGYFCKSYPDTLKALFGENEEEANQSEVVGPMHQQSQPIPPRKTAGNRFIGHRREIVSVKSNNIKHTINEPIAIIGLSGRYPESKDIQEYWQNLQYGKDCIIEVPKERWDWRDFYTEDRTLEGHHYSKYGGFISGVDEFDPRFFNISPRESKVIDPQERLFLQHAWMAVEDAGYTRNGLHNSTDQGMAGQVGVYVGVMYGEYQLFGVQGKPKGLVNSYSSIANRVSYVLNLHGPSMTIDTMCSSSLTAIHLACQDLKLGRTNMAIAGGVNISIHPNKYLFLSAGQFISGHGHCQSFGEGGDGYIPGEGVGVVILKRLPEAIKDGDNIYGVIKGSSLNHGGKTNGYSVPNPKAQSTAISRALAESGVNPRHISYIEAHGTGTKLGDPIEITALDQAFKKHTQDNRYCLIGSAKSNIGHCESAAGIAGLTKVLLQMKYKKIVPSLHSAKLNPYIDFQKTPFIVNQSLKEWEQPIISGQKIPRIAGVSSFGAGGSNAHIILEEYEQPKKVNQYPAIVNSDKTFIVPISARTIEQLKQKIADLLDYIEFTQPELSETAYTLQTGREAMDERLGFMVRSMEQLANGLKAYMNDEPVLTSVFQGRVKRNKDEFSVIINNAELEQNIEKWINQQENSKILDLWVKGFEFDWNRLYKENKPNRISLPTYPFAKEKYWINTEKKGYINSTPSANKVIHPLLHTNTSDLTQQSYSSVFNGSEFIFFNSHLKSDQGIGFETLSTSAYIEMARVAVENALSMKEEDGVIELQNVVLGQPFTIFEEDEITIALFSKDNDLVEYEVYSSDKNEEIIHCQGSAIFKQPSVPAKLDIEQLKFHLSKESITGPDFYNGLKQKGVSFSSEYKGIAAIYSGEGQLLVQLNRPSIDESADNEYIIHPIILDGALQASNLLFGNHPAVPLVFDSVGVFSPCAKDMYAWIRLSNNSLSEQAPLKINIDLCDQFGNLCVQLKGITFQLNENHESVEVPTSQLVAETSQTLTKNMQDEELITPVKISIIDTLPLESDDIETKINPGIPLVKLTGLTEENIPSKQIERAAIQLEDANVHFSIKKQVSANSLAVSLFNIGNGIFSIEIADEYDNLLTKDLILQIIAAFTKVQQQDSVKAVIFKGTDLNFLHGGLQSYNEAIKNKLFDTLKSFPHPIIAEMEGDAGGVGLLLGVLCDLMICSEEGTYYYTTPEHGLYPSDIEYQIFEERFGAFRATDFLYNSTELTGKELKKKGYTFPVLPKNQIKSFVKKLALNLSTKSEKSLSLLKKHLGQQIKIKAGLLATTRSSIVDNKPGKLTKKISSPFKHIHLKTHNENILEIRMGSVAKGYGIKTIVDDLGTVFSQLKDALQYKTILLTSEQPGFLPEVNDDIPVNDLLSFQKLVFESQLPVIAVLDSNTRGLAWIMALYCDACIYNQDGIYSVNNKWQSSKLAKQAAMILSHRFGENFAKEILLTRNEFTGFELNKRVGSLQIAQKQAVLRVALKIAGNWTKMPFETIISWKKQIVQEIRDKIKILPAWSEPKEAESKPFHDKPTNLSLKSKVISAISHPEGILVVKLEDRQAKNMFSQAIEEGMAEVFDHIEQSLVYKVVVLVGYDNYFASGGTKDALLAIQEGKTKFTDTKIFQRAMLCKLPVIAAMQGHGIGAGWSMGMFADFVLFSKESKYVSPYMNFGFTPGAGATYIFTEKMGHDLARETMFTAQEFSGSELESRGISFPVLPRQKVYEASMNLARQIAKYSRSQLIAFKNQFTHHQLIEAEEVFKLELSMHEKTFVGQSDTLNQIISNFDLGNFAESSQKHTSAKISSLESIQLSENEDVNSSRDIGFLHEITENLRRLLAGELHLQDDEIEDHIQFIDLGLDSITGVTWIRKINEKYKTSIEATKIYSYPTLAQLSQFVKDKVEKLGFLTNKSEKPLIENSVLSFHMNENQLVEDSSFQNIDILPEIISNIRRFLADELHLEEHEIDENIQFIDLGLDSITGVTLIRKINEKYKISIEATKIYSYPTLEQLSRFVKDEAEQQGALSVKTEKSIPLNVPDKLKIPSTVNVPQLVSRRNGSAIRKANDLATKHKSESIAVIGMSGQFPEANNLDEYWQNIAGGKNCISEIPLKRWDLDTYFQEGNAVPGKTNSKWMGLLEDYDMFDPIFFNISPTEAKCLNPQQRLFLQNCWNTLENAGYNPKKLSGSKCGVFVGCASGDYVELSKKYQLSAHGFIGDAISILAARISYYLNLQGPCLSIDTACSSSLVAIATACESLNSGASDLALAGGVYIMTSPNLHIRCSQAGMLSSDGRCYTFDQRANGFVPGEGVGVVMLKRLSDAERDKDRILGVIKGWGMNQDGKTNGITAPNSESQARLEQEVYDRYNINPEKIQLIEAHGTGTKLGDPIEVDALKMAFKKYTKTKQYCAIGSVKSNIGHCLTAAGVASFIKVLLALKHKQLPPTINFDNTNEHISLKDSPFYVNDKLQEWNLTDAEQRQAAISAFGFSGTNAHIVLSEYLSPVENKQTVSVITQNKKIIIPLSARNQEQLTQKASDLLKFIQNNQSLSLLEMAYTLQIGRDEMDERVGFLVDSLTQLTKKLQAYIDGANNEEDIYQGQVKQSKEGINIISQDNELKETIIEKYISDRKLSKLLSLWVKGLEFDWNKLYGQEKPERIELPTYPFAKERYWLEEDEAAEISSKRGNLIAAIHPLLHRNTSNLSEQKYSSVFSGDEFFLKNHQINGHSVLSATTCLEMVRASIVDATSNQANSINLELCNIIWEQPVIVTTDKEINIALFANGDEKVNYEIYSSDNEEEVVYSQGEAIISDTLILPKIDIERLKEEMVQRVGESAHIYTTLLQTGINYGEAFQVIESAYYGVEQLLVRLSLNPDLIKLQSEFGLHPSLMEGINQACMALLIDKNDWSDQALQPAEMDSLSILSDTYNEMFAWVRFVQNKSPYTNGKTANQKLDIDVCDNEGNICIQIRGLQYNECLVCADYSKDIEQQFKEENSTVENKIFPTQEPSQQLFFKEHWQKETMPQLNGKSVNHHYIIFLESGDNGESDNSRYADQFPSATIVRQATEYKKVANKLYHCRYNNVDDIQNIINDVSEDLNKKTNNSSIVIIYSWSKGQKEMGVYALFELFKAVQKNAHQIGKVLITGHYEPSLLDTCWDYSWIGFERSLKNLLPDTQVSILYTSSLANTTQQLQDALHNGGIIWYNNDQRHVLSFESANLNNKEEHSLIKQKGSYLITGGCGALGFKFAHYLAEQYQANLILLGRSPSSASIEKKLDELRQAGAKEVHYYAVDVSDEKAVASFGNKIPFKISGLIHAAGVEALKPFFEKTKDEVDQVLLPKSTGTILLDKALDNQSLDFVCYFSSTAALFGDFGSCDYAIANRFQMAYGQYRKETNHLKGKTVVINWPLWQEGGMGFKDDEKAQEYIKMSAQDYGQEVLTTQVGLTIWQDILQTDQHQLLAMIAKPRRFERFLTRIYHGRKQIQMTSENREQATGNENGYKYANKVEEVYSLILPSVESKMEYLTFCPFESKKPGFSMSRAYLNPKKYSEERRYMHIKQTEMRQVLFCNEDFDTINSVFDFGCGHGTDVIQIGTLFSHIQVHGFTITGGQAHLGNNRLAYNKLGSRVKIFHNDSTKDSFPSKYDLIFGIEVTPHIENKEGLFTNICNALNENGKILLMDVISNQDKSVIDQSVGMNVPTQEEWIKLMTQFNLEVDQFIDVSREVANFLYDPDVQDNIKGLPEAIQKTYISYAEFSAALEQKLQNYVLVRLKKNNKWNEQELEEYNWKKLKNPTSYSTAHKNMLKQGKIQYPSVIATESETQSLEAKFSSPYKKESKTLEQTFKSSSSTSLSVNENIAVSLKNLQFELKQSLAKVLNMSISAIDSTLPFGDLGMDSFLGLEWVTSINNKYRISLPNIVVYDYPSIKELSEFVNAEIKKLQISEPTTASVSVTKSEKLPSDFIENIGVSQVQLRQELKTGLAEVLNMNVTAIDPTQSFGDLGLDSFLGLEWVTAINNKYGTSLPNIVVYDYPNVNELALFLESEIKKMPKISQKQIHNIAQKAPSLPLLKNTQNLRQKTRNIRNVRSNGKHASNDKRTHSDKIAIVGMSGQYPKASNLQQFWDNISQGKNAIEEIPLSHWDVNKYYDPDMNKQGKMNTRWMGAIDDFDCFDSLFFRISPQEAKSMDPQHRLFLQEAYKAFEDAGYSRNNLSNTKCGVYLGIASNDYSMLISKNNIKSAKVTSNSHSIAASRIAYYLNLKGPAISIDTACSSSLVAIHLACQSLLTRETSMALAGGISLWILPDAHKAMSLAGMFAPDGQCKAFDDSADGIVVSEGVGAVVLKRLEDAERDNDTIYGVIAGSGINQDGKTNGITAPSVNSQIDLLRDVYQRYDIDPQTINYVEAHGTGTKLGDPIELTALNTVYKEKSSTKNYCALASVKSNIGHTAAAAGVASVHKVLLSLKNRTLVPTLNIKKETTLFDFKNSPFFLNTEKRAWNAEPGSIRRAAINSFGYSGTNAHVVIEEYQKPDVLNVSENFNKLIYNKEAGIIVPLSARNKEQLHEKANDLLNYLINEQEINSTKNGAKNLDLVSMAYTLQSGREAMEERLAIIVHSINQLIDKLKAFVNDEQNIEGVFCSDNQQDDDELNKLELDDVNSKVDQLIAENKLVNLVGLWIKGFELNWNKLYSERKPQRISLPAYPFAKERYWIDNKVSDEVIENKQTIITDLERIEDIFDNIENHSMEADQAVNAIKALI